ncbi:mannan endo-1,6-alpha-mannosidase DCW1 precursor [Delitschia confertaspora ATCC 74209]|uniref:Mannan endo-1,6-alpha-mannosidase n=1 Tax=Delitschia confertaspora ATCC 74209 TaxID=1513339 RepID=A0A9P4JH76_9PLEO|nr:mannan endo-1,6-alpha-mannosidase DCW1 precursor [Delitschia confertaspora ATCC 74209]
MKFSRTALGVLMLSASSVGAMDLNPDDPENVKSVASTIAAGMRKWYTGDRPGDVPGNLPQPYYWWEAGAMFGALIDYQYYTGDTQYNDITTKAMVHQIGENNAFMPLNQTKTLGNDDQAFWGMAAMSAAEVKFPDPPEGQSSWLSLAQGVFNTQASRWDTTTCGGGLRWQIFQFNNGYNYKNTISNGCFFNIAARLGKYTGNQTYVDWAEKMWDWVESIHLMEIQKDGGYHFYDGSDDTINCTKANHIQWTYNAGVFLLGAATMWNITDSDIWKTRTTRIINGTNVFFSNDAPNVMTEVACEGNGKCDVDQRSFKAYLSRWMAATIKVAPWTFDLIMPRLRASAVAAAKQCSGGEDGKTCGLKWTTNGVWDGSYGVGEQMSALEVVQAMLINKVDGPVSEKTGGISKSNPSAGSESTDKPITFDEITTGDKAGAGFLTALALIAILGGAWWMVS